MLTLKYNGHHNIRLRHISLHFSLINLFLFYYIFKCVCNYLFVITQGAFRYILSMIPQVLMRKGLRQSFESNFPSRAFPHQRVWEQAEKEIKVRGQVIMTSKLKDTNRIHFFLFLCYSCWIQHCVAIKEKKTFPIAECTVFNQTITIFQLLNLTMNLVFHRVFITLNELLYP